MLSLLTASLLAFVPKIQEPPAPAQPAPEAAQEPAEQKAAPKRVSRRKPQMAPNDPDAVAFLAELVAEQQLEDDLPPVTAFRMEFKLRDYPPDRGGNELDVRVDFRSADAPQLDQAADSNGEARLGFEEIRLTAHDPAFKEKVSKGLDAEGYWLRDGAGDFVSLEAKEYASDRLAIDQTLTLCEDFLLLFDLDQLGQRAGGLKLSSTETETILSGEMVRSRELWRFQLVVEKGQALPSSLILELPESARVKPAPAQGEPSTEGEATNEAQAETAEAALAPQVLSYYFSDWQPHAGRLLPVGIDEYHGVVTLDTYPRRVIDVKRFLWRVPAEIMTWRGEKNPVTEGIEAPAESGD